MTLHFTPDCISVAASGLPRLSLVGGSTPVAQTEAKSVLATAPLIQRTWDAAEVNHWANAPDIRPFIGDIEAGVVDVAQSIGKPENLYLFGEHGGFALTWSAPGVYEVHTLIGKEGRGPWAYRAAAAMIDFAQDVGARQLWTRVEPSATNVAAFAKHFGMKPTGMTVDAAGVRYDVLSMEVA